MQKTMADIEVKKFAEMVSAIGRDTLAAISRAGPETQVTQLLMGLGTRKSVFWRKPFFRWFENNKDTDPGLEVIKIEYSLKLKIKGRP